MKDAIDNKLLKPVAGPSNAVPKRHRGSFSSNKSVRTSMSTKSVDSQRASRHGPRSSLRVSGGRPRPRGLSLSSMQSQAISTTSADSNALSKKTSHADDSDATESNESLGESEEDVWFPTRAREPAGSDDIKMSELDQLLNLSDYDEPPGTPAMSAGRRRDGPRDGRREGTSVSVVEEALTDADDERAEEPENLTLGPAAVAQPPHSRFFAIRKDTGEAPGPRADPPGRGTAAAGQTPSPNSIPLTYKTESEGQTPSPKSLPLTFKIENYETSTSDPSGSTSDPSGSTSDPSGSMDPEKVAEPKPYDPPPSTYGRSAYANDVSSLAVNDPPEDEPSQRYSFFASNMDSTIHAPDLASLVGQSDSFSSLFKPENGVWFLDCFRPTEVEMKALSRAFGIHPLTSEDIQVEDAREKFEMFRRYYLVVYHTFENDVEDENYLQPINFYMLVFSEGVISFHFEPVSHCRNVRRRMRRLRDYLTFSSDWIAYALIDDITDSFAPAIQTIEAEADYVEAAIYRESEEVEISTLLARLGEARKRTMQLLRMLTGKADVVRGFAKRCTESHNMPGHEMALYLGDIQDHIVTMSQNLSAYEKIFSRAHFNYMGLLQMEFVNSSNRMTSVLGRVTILGTVLVPMNLITGLFGMNVKVPGQDGSNLGWFFGILGVILLMLVVLMVGGHLYIKMTERNHIMRPGGV